MEAAKVEFLQDQLTKAPEESKKWRAAKIGLWGIASFFAIGVMMFMWQPIAASQVVLLCQTVIGAWTATIAVYLGAQGSVDFKTTQVLGSAINTTNSTERVEHVFHEDGPFVYHQNEGGPDVRPWAMTTGDDEQ